MFLLLDNNFRHCFTPTIPVALEASGEELTNKHAKNSEKLPVQKKKNTWNKTSSQVQNKHVKHSKITLTVGTIGRCQT